MYPVCGPGVVQLKTEALFQMALKRQPLASCVHQVEEVLVAYSQHHGGVKTWFYASEAPAGKW